MIVKFTNDIICRMVLTEYLNWNPKCGFAAYIEPACDGKGGCLVKTANVYSECNLRTFLNNIMPSIDNLKGVTYEICDEI